MVRDARNDCRPFSVHDVSEALKTSWIRHLMGAYRYHNWYYLGDALRMPVLQLGDSVTAGGEWDRVHRMLTISIPHLLSALWETVIETLRHEMAHQYVDEVLHAAHEPPHGEAFAHACRLLRLEPAARMDPRAADGLAASTNQRDRILTRIKELMAMAASPNVHEAETAMRLARRELTRYNLSLGDLDAGVRYDVRYLLRGQARIQQYQYALASILQAHFFVRVVWVKSYAPLDDRDETVMKIMGTPENLDVAGYVHAYLTSAGERLWKEYKQAHPHGGVRKVQYLAGLMSGLREKLDAEAKGLQLQENERALIRRGDQALEAFFRHLHPRTRSLSHSGVSYGESFAAGRRDGRAIVISRPITSSASRGRLLE